MPLYRYVRRRRKLFFHAIVKKILAAIRGNTGDDLQIRDENGKWRSADNLIKGSSATLHESLSSGDEEDYPWVIFKYSKHKTTKTTFLMI